MLFWEPWLLFCFLICGGIKLAICVRKCPGLGTATGRVPLKEAARQMAIAYKNFKNPTTNLNWKNLNERDQLIMARKE